SFILIPLSFSLCLPPSSHLCSSALSPQLILQTWSCSWFLGKHSALNSITHTHARRGWAGLCVFISGRLSQAPVMAQCRSYLRGLDICVTVLLLVSGMLMIVVGFISFDGNKPVEKLLDELSSSDGLLVLQVLGPITVVLSLLGLCAASLDIKPLLLLFSALTFVEFVALIVVASPLIQIQAQMDSAVEEVFLSVTPLHKTETYIKQELSKLQASESCCGLRSFEDWEDQLPASCLCAPPTPFPSNSCDLVLNVPFYSMTIQSYINNLMPYCTIINFFFFLQPCGPILKSYLSFPIKLRIGIISAVTTITIAAIALSLALGLERYWRRPAVESTVDDSNRVKYQLQPYLTWPYLS
ncbi:hypothetical protein NQD34_017008, partial [Periophthalmus magnuspinnatus]